MENNTEGKSNETQGKKTRRKSIKNDKVILNKIIELLSIKSFTRYTLAKEIKVDKLSLTDGVLLEAVKIAGNAKFLENLDRQPPGKSEVFPKYIEKKGILIQPSHFINKVVTDGQLYDFHFDKKGIITLTPQKPKKAATGTTKPVEDSTGTTKPVESTTVTTKPEEVPADTRQESSDNKGAEKANS